MPRPRPSKVYFCYCFDCSQRTSFNPLVGRFVPGRQWSKKLYSAHLLSIRSNTHDPPTSDHNDVVEGTPSLSPTSLEPDRPPSPEPDRPPSSLDTSQDDAELLQLEEEFNTRRKDLQDLKGLIFLRPPQLSDLVAPPPLSLGSQFTHIDSQYYALDYGRLANRPILGYLQWLHVSTETLWSLTLSSEMDGRRVEFLRRVEKEVDRIETLKVKEWERQHKDQGYARGIFLDGKIPVFETTQYYLPPEYSQYTLIYAVYLLLAVLYTITGVSMDSLKFTVAGIRTVIELTFKMAGAHDSEAKRTNADIPLDINVILDRLKITAVSRGYVCCVRCFACYDIDNYPDRCTKVDAAGDDPCRAWLRKSVRRSGSFVADTLDPLTHAHPLALGPLSYDFPISKQLSGMTQSCPRFCSLCRSRHNIT